MNGMGLPEAVAILHNDRVYTEAEWCAYIAHPASGDWHKFTTLRQLHRIRPVGGDGCFTPTFSPPALPCGHGEHLGGNAAAPSGVSPHHQQASKARWS